ncbi:PucR family transcriptional regulator [Streptomyces sp. NBC_01451]|uniref:PucR family transcriptional regulator n=1 Tax=Streptomyces sp. NBC_01451 TaxID=2903872 RepID=UPI002E357D0D|nr:helix-turn-helix domain-containing protein [Streptomyces sp. NBC_01451]
MQGVVVWDVLEPTMLPGQILLAVGVEPQSSTAVDVIRAAGQSGAVAVIFGANRPGQSCPEVRSTATEAGVAVLFRTPWVTWAQLVGVLRAGLTAVGCLADPQIAQVTLGDLEGLADAVATMVGGAVTIEDLQSRVLSYSSTDEDVDDIRRRTILGRRVPDAAVAVMRETGFFRLLWGSGDVVRRPAEEDLPERLVVAVTAGGEALGSIWVAAAGRPLPKTAEEDLRAAARAAAPHLLHHRSRRAGQVQVVQEMARALLEGSGSAEALAARTALPIDGRYAVLAVHAVPGQGIGWHEDRVPDLVAVQCAAHGHEAVVMAVAGGVHVLLGDLAPEPRRAAAQVARLGEALAGQLSAAISAQVRVGLGEVTTNLHQAAESRRTADLALRALLSREGPRAVARVGEVAEAVAMLHIVDTLREVRLPMELPVTRLAAYDAEHGGTLVDTLRAYLDQFSDVPAASRALGVHPNTLRYRIRRVREVCGIELDDPDARLLAQLQLRLMRNDDADNG